MLVVLIIETFKRSVLYAQGFLSQSNHRHLIQVLWVAGYVYIAEVWIKKEAGGGDGENVIL